MIMTQRVLVALGLALALADAAAPPLYAQATPPHDRADTLRGSIGPERAWWDVTFYDLHVAVSPADSTIRGSNGIVYRVLEPATTLQIDLQPPLVVDSVTRGGHALEHRRDGNVVWVDVPEATPGELDTVTVHYQGRPRVAVNPPWDGGFAWAADDRGGTWIATANQGLGASVWWPNKDTQADEPDSQRIAITVPKPLVNVSNGRLRSVTEHDDGTATWEWFVASPINNYDVAVNAGSYTHFGGIFQGELGPLTLDFWPLEHNLEKAREQFEQVPVNLACFEHWFGPFPWYEDGYTLVETPHLGMEHQSAVAYGNGYRNGYRGRDLSGTGLGLEWDFIIVHENAHEWWGNSITTADLADMWVHESFANYSESLHTECLRDEEAGARYVRGTRAIIQNDRPIIPAFGVNAEGSGDMYPKGGNMLHTIRQIVDDDARWRSILRGIQSTFRHSIVTGDQVRAYISEHAGIDLDPVFRQYLTTTMIPTLELRAADAGIEYRWADAVEGLDMPVDVKPGDGACIRLEPTTAWQAVDLGVGDPAAVGVDRDWYVGVRRLMSGPSAESSGPAPPEADCGG
jgi:aminopeptidase N